MIDDIKSLVGNKPDQISTNQQKKVLIVEDDPTLGDALSIKLQKENFITLRATNGQEGLETINVQKPDVVLLDLMMPVMDGKTMLTKVREIPEFKKLPVLVLTNAGEVENINNMMTINEAVEFLVKSNTSLEEIIVKIKRYTHSE